MPKGCLVRRRVWRRETEKGVEGLDQIAPFEHRPADRISGMICQLDHRRCARCRTGWLLRIARPDRRARVPVPVRLYVDKRFLKHTLREWGILAPVIFIALQALQVIIAPIPGEVTGILGGYLFGQWIGLLYSTIGLTLGSVAALRRREVAGRSLRSEAGQPG